MNLQNSKIHFVGIGGIGMSGIAEVLNNMGCRVTGSDQSENTQVIRLKTLGVAVFIGHRAQNVAEDCQAVVFSSAVSPKNPELLEAKKRKIPVIQRAEMLAELMRLKRGIAIAGTHGKTTTTSMMATMMVKAHLDPTIVIGGRLDLIKSNAALGRGPWFLAEADESDGSFLKLQPEMLVITNIDNDHLENFGSFSQLQASFMTFAEKIPFYGCAVFCVDDPWVAKLTKNFSKRCIRYGFSKKAQLCGQNLKASEGQQVFNVSFNGKNLGTIQLKVPGKHNALNSLAVVAMGLELGLGFEIIKEGLESFKGVDRRLQKMGEWNGVEIFDDYGHHPTEVRATLQALRELRPKRRIVVAFQPHRYTRTKECWRQFLTCFKDADLVGLFDIYAAHEKPIKKITSQHLAQAINKKNIVYWGSVARPKVELIKILKAGDIFLTLGAGDVYKISKQFLLK
jgi:UDP-N-acetylmuramate--alanine ligase